MAKKEMIKLSESQLREIVKESVTRVLDEQSLIMEMSLPMSAFSDKLHSKIWPAFENLACICIFHDINQQILPHWAERATEPYMPWFSQEITKETPQKRNTAVNKAFNMMFNEDYSAIAVGSFQNLISYYANRANKALRMEATNTAEYYYETYKGAIVQLLNIMKECLINKDYNKWVTTISDFYEQFITEQ